MADKTVTTRHAITGHIDNATPVHVARHPVLGKHLVEVPEGTKPFVPELISHKLDKDAEGAAKPAETAKAVEDKATPTTNKNGKD